jgi:hypothetical protein
MAEIKKKYESGVASTGITFIPSFTINLPLDQKLLQGTDTGMNG